MDMCRYGNMLDQAAKSPGISSEERYLPFASCTDGYAYTSPVGGFKPNAFGLYDMAGDAWQWTEDCWHDTYEGAPSDGSAWTSGDCTRRVVRGASWLESVSWERVAGRFGWYSALAFNTYGFRVARSLSP
jgi:formylglycine-generating enzyme